MRVDFAELDDTGALELAVQLLAEMETAEHVVDEAERRVQGIKKWIYGLVEMFPAVEDLLPPDFDTTDDPRPRGASAVLRVLMDNTGRWYSVPAIVDMLDRRDWLPNSSKPANAVRTALERLVERGDIQKSRSIENAVIYRWGEEEDEPRDYGNAEPF